MSKKDKQSGERVIENRRSRFEYAIGETLETGMKLHGWEVKSVRGGQVSLGEGWVSAEIDPARGGPALFLHGVNIAEYGPAAAMGLKPVRMRKLLAHKREVLRMWKAAQIKGNTLVPLKVYFKNGFAKCLIGVGTGRKKHDKRQAIAERESKRDIDRAMSKKAK